MNFEEMEKKYGGLIPKSPFENGLPLSEENYQRAMKIKKDNESTIQPDKTISFLCEMIQWQRQWIENSNKGCP